MRFRTEIEIHPSDFKITHNEKIILLGSCFTDHIGAKLAQDGFNVCANPFGPFFNPISILKIISESPALTVQWGERVHCLDLPSPYQAHIDNQASLECRISQEYTVFQKFLGDCHTAIITLGSAHTYIHIPTGKTVANCHKFPSSEFRFHTISLQECINALNQIIKVLESKGIRNFIFTLSPVHHLDRGLEGNFVSKATLRLAIESVLNHDIIYFPAFEIMNDDLRDYRFFASDMKHPSEVAIEYIYDKFGQMFFSPETRTEAISARKKWLQSQHRTIITE